MGWFHFKIKIVKTVETTLLKKNTDKHVLKCALFSNVTTNNELCCAVITNNWMTLNQCGIFEVRNNLEINTQ